MTRSRHLLVTAVIFAIVAIGIVFGWFKFLDDALRDMRFATASVPATGEIVFLEITPQSLAAAGSASRARSLYAAAVDKVMEAGARTVVLDVGLSGTLGYFDDTSLTDALLRAQGAARTAAYLVERTDSGGETYFELQMPLDRFTAAAPPVFVDTDIESGGPFREYETRIPHDGWIIESLATALTPERVTGQRFLIDYGIDLSTIARITISDLLEDRVASGVLEGKQVVMGLGGVALQQGVPTPRYGTLSRTSVQLLAAETVRQNRMLTEVGSLPALIFIIAGGLAIFALRSRVPMMVLAAGSVAYAMLIELTALVLHVHAGMMLDTAAIQVAQLVFLVAVFGQELESRGHSLTSAWRERDSMRGILERIVADNFDGVVVVDQSHVIRAASQLAEELVAPALDGCKFETVLPKAFHPALIAALEDGRVSDRVVEADIPGKDGNRTVEFVVTLSSVEAGNVSAEAAGRVACLTFRDITERRLTEERLTYLAQHDPLTGAASRVHFIDIANQMLATPKGRIDGASVFIFGLSRVKMINDTLGHAFGDELLKQVVGRLRQTEALCIARLEGNSFAVLMPGKIADLRTRPFVDSVLASITSPYALNGHHAIIGACVGMTDTELSGSSPDTLVSHASMALSIASDTVGSSVVTFSQEMDARIKTKQEMEIALRAALARGEFTVHYQPQVDLDSGEIIGVEALTRWTHPQLGNVSPAEFIPAAEETGLIIALGRWVLQTACAEVATWPKPIRLSVNVSPMQFEHGDIVTDVRAALALSGLPPERLDIEITESLLVSEGSHVSEKLRQVREDGVGVALDDFGTGYSSLGYLGRLPVDKIKIDQRFVRGLPEDVEATAIIRAVLMLSESLGKDVVAEGIESQDQAWLLRLAGCRTGQGFFFARPAPAETILNSLAAANTDRLLDMRVGGKRP